MLEYVLKVKEREEGKEDKCRQETKERAGKVM
jgi:hypothetical protein